MKIESLDLRNFRNYPSLTFVPGDGINILYGDNAQGKTNVLEAVCLLGTSRSHRGAKDKEMIRSGETEAHLRVNLTGIRGRDRIDMHLRRDGAKGIAINRQPVRRAGELLGLLPVVFFSPEDLSIIKSGPQVRRRFINTELCQIDSLYTKNLSSYSRCLMQRNKLLRDIAFDGKLLAELEAWDTQLLKYGSALIAERKKFLAQLHETVGKIHADLTQGKEELTLFYEPNTEAEDFSGQLFKARETDLKYKTTSVGPHRDDFRVMIGSEDARIYGSQGQQRSAALSLKLAEIELLRKAKGEEPVLLLDDVLSELDRTRQEMLLARIGTTQTFLTCTGVEDILSRAAIAAESRVFYVENGTVTPKE
ncbi:MAG: DNA replication/repair protein RecF [Lachnospiraceae bacterium]|nr:DNA replication/repair protein RecF [Lachnospiraceae bacterium]